VTTTANSDTDIDVGELVETNDQERLVDLESQDFWLNEVERLSVNLNKSLTGLNSIMSVYQFSSCHYCNIAQIVVPCSGRPR